METRKFLVVVDPCHERHLALERMTDIARQRSEWISDFHLLIGFEGEDKTDPDSPKEVVRSLDWLTEILRPLDGLDVEYTAELLWTSSWRQSILDAADRYGCDTIMLPESSAEHKKHLTDSKWELIRAAKGDVIICDKGTSGPIKCILAAINVQAKDETHRALNEKIIERAQFLAKYFDADLQVVNAYSDSEDFPDRDLMMRMTGLPREKVHRDMGKPGEVIARMVEKLHADMVVLGISPSKGLAARFSSHVTEKVMESIDVDVVALG